MADRSDLKRDAGAGLDTPVPIVDLAVVGRNIARLQRACDAAGVGNRPHIKTHKSTEMARLQIEAGAVGITCQKIGEAEVMADTGFDDILVSYNIIGEPKLRRLSALAERTRVTVSCDSATVTDGLSRAGAGLATPLPVLVECDTGRRRCGAMSVGEAVALAKHVSELPGLREQFIRPHSLDGRRRAVARAADRRAGESGLSGTRTVLSEGRRGTRRNSR